MTEDTLLRLAGVHTHIGRYHILHGVDLAVRRGRLTMLLGRNGAGKTTSLRTIMGLWRPSAGEIVFDGAPIGGLETPDIARLGIAYVPESMGIFTQLTVRENLLLATGPEGFEEARLEEVLTLFPALRQKWANPAGALSGGQKQMLAISRAIIEKRRLLVVDEPTKGLAPAVIQLLIDAFLRLKSTETTILLVEQNFHMAALAADEALQQHLLGLSLASHQ
jgi:branched-chain amino acid transport system ATP-binding protein